MQYPANPSPKRPPRPLSGFEKLMLLAMLAVLGITSMDAMDGRLIGLSGTLNLAESKGQQLLSAFKLSVGGPH